MTTFKESKENLALGSSVIHERWSWTGLTALRGVSHSLFKWLEAVAPDAQGASVSRETNALLQAVQCSGHRVSPCIPSTKHGNLTGQLLLEITLVYCV